MASRFPFAGEIGKHVAELWPFRHGKELSRNGVIRQARQPVFGTRKLRVMAGNLVASEFEEGFVVIAFPGFQQSIDRFFEIVFFDRICARVRAFSMRVLASH